MEEAFSELYTCRVRSEINGGLVAIKMPTKLQIRGGKNVPTKLS